MLTFTLWLPKIFKQASMNANGCNFDNIDEYNNTPKLFKHFHVVRSHFVRQLFIKKNKKNRLLVGKFNVYSHTTNIILEHPTDVCVCGGDSFQTNIKNQPSQFHFYYNSPICLRDIFSVNFNKKGSNEYILHIIRVIFS